MSLSVRRLLDCLVEAEHSEEIEKFGHGGIVREIKMYVKITQDTQVIRQRVTVVKEVRELIGKHGFSQFVLAATWRAIQTEEVKCFVL